MVIGILPIERLPESLPLFEKAYLNTGESGVFNPESALNFWLRQYERQTGAVIVVEDNAGLSAVMGLVVTSDPATGDLHMNEYGWFSTGRHGFKLVDFAILLAEKMKVKKLFMHSVNNDSAEKVDKFYRKKGCQLMYFRYVREI